MKSTTSKTQWSENEIDLLNRVKDAHRTNANQSIKITEQELKIDELERQFKEHHEYIIRIFNATNVETKHNGNRLEAIEGTIEHLEKILDIQYRTPTTSHNVIDEINRCLQSLKEEIIDMKESTPDTSNQRTPDYLEYKHKEVKNQ